MRIKKILVTGASGFLGCRLVEQLLLGEKVPVRAMAHRAGSAARLSRLPVEIAWADITDPKSVEQALEGCNVVVHCAYGVRGNRRTVRRVTVEGTRILAEAALSCGVSRFIHVSTVAVYSYSPPSGVVEEKTPFIRSGEPYCDDKIDAEKIIWKLINKRNLPATVLRMGNIYGPFSAPWTMRPLTHIRDGYITLVDRGNHNSNMVFVDNAVEGILRAIKEEKAIGEAFFVTDDELSWKMLYGYYASWLGNVTLLSIDSTEVEGMLHLSFADKLRSTYQAVQSVFLPVAKYIWQHIRMSQFMGVMVDALLKHIPHRLRTQFKNLILLKEDMLPQDSRLLPPVNLLQVYAGRAIFSNEKAKRMLGYRPLISVEQAARITKDWAHWARLI